MSDIHLDGLVIPPREQLFDAAGPRQEIAIVEQAITEGPGSLLRSLTMLAQRPDVNPATVAAWAEIQARLEAREAERQFTAALMRLPAIHVKKNGMIDLTSKDDRAKGAAAFTRAVPFAKWEDMARVIEPLLEANGFRLMFNSAPRQGEGGGLVVTGTLMHIGGHSISASMPLPLDTGPGRNNLQAGGSTLSYGKRYTTEMLLNIVRDGDDDDGKDGGTKRLTVPQMEELLALLNETGRNEAQFIGRLFGDRIHSVDEVEAGAYEVLKNSLLLVRQQQQKGRQP